MMVRKGDQMCHNTELASSLTSTQWTKKTPTEFISKDRQIITDLVLKIKERRPARMKILFQNLPYHLDYKIQLKLEDYEVRADVMDFLRFRFNGTGINTHCMLTVLHAYSFANTF